MAVLTLYMGSFTPLNGIIQANTSAFYLNMGRFLNFLFFEGVAKKRKRKETILCEWGLLEISYKITCEEFAFKKKCA